MIIGIVNQKGGVGKSTLALNLAHLWAMADLRVLLIDADRQRSIAMMAGKREADSPLPVEMVEMARDDIAQKAILIAEDYDHVIIDGPRDAEKITRAVIAASDFVLLPYEPSGFSIDAGETTIAQFRECQGINADLIGAIVISKRNANTRIGRDFRTALSRTGLRVLNTVIENRVAHAESVTWGLTVFEHAPKSKAAREIALLGAEIERIYRHDD